MANSASQTDLASPSFFELPSNSDNSINDNPPNNPLNYNSFIDTVYNNNNNNIETPMTNPNLNFQLVNQICNAPKPIQWNPGNPNLSPIAPTMFFYRPGLFYQQITGDMQPQQPHQPLNIPNYSESPSILLNADYCYQWSNYEGPVERQCQLRCQMQFRIREISEEPQQQQNDFVEVPEDTQNNCFEGEIPENNPNDGPPIGRNFNENPNNFTTPKNKFKKFKPLNKPKKWKNFWKDGPVQRSNGSKGGHQQPNNRKSHKDHQQPTQTLVKNSSSESSISINGNRQQNQQQQQQNRNRHQQNDRNNAKQQNTRFSKPRQDGGQQQQQPRAVQKRSREYSISDWLEKGEMVYYERRRGISSSGEDKQGSTDHRNSTASETSSPSEDLTTSSSHEDLREAAYAVAPKCKKNVPKSRNRRQQQQKRKKQVSESGNSNNDDNEEPMDVDTKSIAENVRPNNNNNKNNSSFHQRNNFKNQTNQDRKKNNNGQKTNNNNGFKNAGKPMNVLKNSNANLVAAAASAGKRNATSQLSSPLNCSSSSVNSSSTASPTTTHKRTAENIKKKPLQISPQSLPNRYSHYTEFEFIELVKDSIIEPSLLRVYGFPVESAIHHGCIEIYKVIPKTDKDDHHHHQHHHHHRRHHNHNNNHQQNNRDFQVQQSFWYPSNSNVININDGLYVNGTLNFKYESKEEWAVFDDVSSCTTESTDSGQGSGESSPPSVDSDTGEGVEDEPNGTTALYTPDGSYQIFSQYDQSLEKQCIRCKKAFHVTESGEYLNREPCSYHWGKSFRVYGRKGYGTEYSCCHGDDESQGCVYNELHVWTGAVVGLNGPYTDFVYTSPRYNCNTGPTKIYALDCEMSFTGRGLEVTKITVIGYDAQIVYEHYVKPDAEIVDYNTRYSGITENDLNPNNSNRSIKTLSEVQRDLLNLISADTILIGHGIDNDLRVLRIVHNTVIDTSICFPHTSGFPFRRSLRNLTRLYLEREIQTGHAGHSSYEDARASLDLMLLKAKLID